MSGNYGWSGNDRSSDYSSGSSYGGYSRAYNVYRNTTSTQDDDNSSKKSKTVANTSTKYVPPDIAKDIVNVTPKASISLSPIGLKLKSTAANVIIVAQDLTGSMGNWRAEILARLALLYGESKKYLGDSLEVLIIGYGDCEYNDNIEVTRFGSGKVLDSYIAALNTDMYGGGNMTESSEIVATFMDRCIDTSSARNVYSYFITDEGIKHNVSRNLVSNYLGISDEIKTNTKDVFDSLLLKGKVFTVLADTRCYAGSEGVIKKTWTDIIGLERILKLDDSRRVVDVMLGVMAKLTGQYAQFTQDLNTRQGNTVFGDVNIDNVHKTIALIDDGNPKPPQLTAGTVSLI